MTAFVERVGPYDNRPDISHIKGDYREDRGTSDIEDYLAKVGFNFSFLEHFKAVVQVFPQDETLHILEGGCGEAGASGDIRTVIGPAVGRNINATAVTQAERNIPVAAERVDHLVVGTVQNAFNHEKLDEGSSHFILDFCGDLYYDYARDGKLIPFGTNILPIYSRLLKPNGTLLVTIIGLLPPERRHPYIFIEPRDEVLTLFQENKLEVVQTENVCALLRKKAD